MKHMLCGLSALATVCCATAAVAEMIETHKVFPPQDIKWSPASPALPRGAETSILYGNPDAEGMFALRIKMPRGFSIPPHTHLRPEVITVISGKLSLGLGEAADRATVESLPVGSLSIMPPRVVHYAFTDEDSINGSGPWAIDYVNPKDDLRLQVAPGLPASEGR